MSTQRRAFEILDFWFGQKPYSAAALSQRMRLWFGDHKAPELQPQTDEQVRTRFGGLVQEAAAGALDRWQSSPRRRLALIVLLDQFPRNIYRATPQAFQHDARALALAREGLLVGADAALDPVERIFFYMPLQHAESIEVQRESLAAFGRLAGESPEPLRAIFDSVLDYARLHHAIVQRFGRFPHRNGLLGRDSSAEENAWLAGSAERFGQQ
jgi:uncharacterized protein (DUF924 family)